MKYNYLYEEMGEESCSGITNGVVNVNATDATVEAPRCEDDGFRVPDEEENNQYSTDLQELRREEISLEMNIINNHSPTRKRQRISRETEFDMEWPVLLTPNESKQEGIQEERTTVNEASLNTYVHQIDSSTDEHTIAKRLRGVTRVVTLKKGDLKHVVYYVKFNGKRIGQQGFSTAKEAAQVYDDYVTSIGKPKYRNYCENGHYLNQFKEEHLENKCTCNSDSW